MIEGSESAFPIHCFLRSPYLHISSPPLSTNTTTITPQHHIYAYNLDSSLVSRLLNHKQSHSDSQGLSIKMAPKRKVEAATTNKLLPHSKQAVEDEVSILFTFKPIPLIKCTSHRGQS
jgi:hypothetical protein